METTNCDKCNKTLYQYNPFRDLEYYFEDIIYQVDSKGDGKICGIKCRDCYLEEENGIY